MQITLRQPDDWHIHLRDGQHLERTVADAAKQFSRAIVMPNLQPPVTTVAQLRTYRNAILAQVPEGLSFTPLMTLYLTADLSPTTLAEARSENLLTAVKFYPAHGTTNAAHGVSDLLQQSSLLAYMEREHIPLLLHGETVSNDCDIFDREKIFIATTLTALRRRYPGLKLVLEHISTADAVAYVRESAPGIAATITAHHLLFNRNHLLAGGIKPHFYCLPILKSETDRQALHQALRSGSDRFFLGTDSAPHEQGKKECACGAAGMYTAHVAIELYAQAFEEAGCLSHLEAFAALNGPKFYQLPVNQKTISLVKENWTAATQLNYASGHINTAAVKQLNWKLV